jgi:hypothetical protein
LVEHIALLDRCIYLEELGYSSYLIPLFDPNISPRNVALIATKEKREQ